MTSPLKSALAEASPIVSVIIPLYNKAQYLEEAVKGITEQGYANLEILIRDDGSTDNSLQVAQSLPDKFPNFSIKVFSGENHGASFCRNFLIERTISPLVVLMDADDLMLPGFIPTAVTAMRNHSARVVYSDVLLSGGRAEEWRTPPFDPFGIRYANCLTSLCMIDRDLWREVGGYDTGMPFNEDWSFFIRAAQLSTAFHKLPGKYFMYRQTSQGLYHSFILDNWSYNLAHAITATPDLYQVDEVLQAIETLKTMPQHWIDKFSDSTRKNPSRSLSFTLLGIACLARNDISNALDLFERAVSLDAGKGWLATLLLGQTIENQDALRAATLFHQVRIKRPDMGRIVNEKISLIAKSLAPQPSTPHA